MSAPTRGSAWGLTVGNDMTSRILERALQAASLRQQVHAHNIANVNTHGFKRSRVDFEDALASATSDGQSIDTVQPKVVTEEASSSRPDGNNVDIESEMTGMAQNEIWNAALTRQISDHFARLRMAINGRG